MIMNKKTKTLRIPKEIYNPPRLVCYGTVRVLTQAGVSGTNENVPGQGSINKRNASDRVLKENIVRIGKHPIGIGLYLFNFKSKYREQLGSDRQFGVMADEVETVMPAAVSTHPDGYKTVDYGMLGINRQV